MQADTLPTAVIPNTTSIQLKNGDATVRGLDIIQDAGFKMVRKGLYWSSTERVRGVYSATAEDRNLDDAAARGETILVTLYGNNALYESGTTGIVTAAGRAGFARFAAAMAARHRNKNIIWEIWNEPNLASFWRAPSNTVGIAAEYTLLVREVVPAMRAADSSAYIVAGSVSCLWSASYVWFDETVRRGLLTTGINAVSVHPYGFNWPELAIPEYARLRSKMDAAGGQAIRIINSEVGYHTDWIVERQRYPQWQAGEVQGWMLVRQQLVDLMSNIGASNWYEFREGTGWGLVGPDFTLNPAFYAAQTFTRELNGYRFVRRVALPLSTDYALLMQNTAGNQKIVVWGTGNPAATHLVTLTIGGTGTTSIRNVTGVASTASITDGRISLNINGAPQYINVPAVSIALRNVALGKVTTASSGQASARYLTDGNVTSDNSRWMSSASYPQTITIDLGGNFTISQLNYLQHTARTLDYRIEVLSGTTWRVVATGTGNSTQRNISRSFTAVSASRVRFIITSGLLYQKAYELQVMGN